MAITTTVKVVMTRDIVSVETSDLVTRAISLMVEKNIGSVVVIEAILLEPFLVKFNPKLSLTI